MGLKYDYKMNRTVYGIYQGYPVLIHSLMTPRNRTSLYQLVINLTPSDKITRKELEKKVKKSYKRITKANFTHNSLEVYIKASGIKLEKHFKNLEWPLNAVVRLLQEYDLKPACTKCAENKDDLKIYSVRFDGEVLCHDCYALAKQEIEAEQYSDPAEEVKENPIMGVIGAIIGSLFGLASILLLDRINLVATLSGFIMGYSVMKGYELLGKKFSNISALIIFIMTIYAVTLSLAIDVAMVNEISIFESYQLIYVMFRLNYLPIGAILFHAFLVFCFVFAGAALVLNKAKLDISPSNGYWELD